MNCSSPVLFRWPMSTDSADKDSGGNAARLDWVAPVTFTACAYPVIRRLSLLHVLCAVGLRSAAVCSRCQHDHKAVSAY